MGDKKSGERRRGEEVNVIAESMPRYHKCKGREMEEGKER